MTDLQRGLISRSQRRSPRTRGLPATRRVLALAICTALMSPVAAADFPAAISLGSLDGSNGFGIDGVSADDRSGWSVAAAGDINGDGIADLIIGAYGADPNGVANAGSSYVVFGRDTMVGGGFPAAVALSQLNGSNGFRVDGEVMGDESGRAVAAAGDVNGDGIDDLIIGARLADAGGSNAGASYVLFGRDVAAVGDFPPTVRLDLLSGADGFRIAGEAVSDESGFAVAAAGDINGDAIADVLVGARLANPGGSDSGAAYVIFGRDTASSGNFPPSLSLGTLNGGNGFRLEGEAAGDSAGFSVSAAGDINGDGFDDLLVGAFTADPGPLNAGASYVVLGRDAAISGNFPASLDLGALDGSNGFRLDGTALNDYSGNAVAAAGDVNGDGLDDLLIGARGADLGAAGAGASYVVFGRNTAVNGNFPATLPLSALDGSDGFRVDGAAVSDRSGMAVSGAGDVNGDGIDDLLIGADRADGGGGNSGASYVLFGRDTAMVGNFPASLGVASLDGSNGFVINGAGTGTYSGSSVSSAGDVNGDGFADVIIGAFAAAPNGSQSGRSYVVFGGLSGPGEIPRLGLDPTELDFGEVEPGMNAIESLRVENIGNGTLEPGMVSISGADAASFDIAVDGCGGMSLSNGEFCIYSVSFAPTAPGPQSALLQVDSNALASPHLVVLRGNDDPIFHDGFE